MTTWIFAVLGLYFIQTMLPISIGYFSKAEGAVDRLVVGMGPRDEPAEMPILGARAERALANFKEGLPLFIVAALLWEIRGETDATALTGATVFFVARALYVPAYISGVLGVRSLMWTVGLVGLVMMYVPFF